MIFRTLNNLNFLEGSIVVIVAVFVFFSCLNLFIVMDFLGDGLFSGKTKNEVRKYLFIPCYFLFEDFFIKPYKQYKLLKAKGSR